jgi:hypothetical protein
MPANEITKFFYLYIHEHNGSEQKGLETAISTCTMKVGWKQIILYPYYYIHIHTI